MFNLAPSVLDTVSEYTIALNFDVNSMRGPIMCILLKGNNIILLLKYFRTGPVTGPRSAVLARGRRPMSSIADRGPVTRPMRNYLINDNFIN